MNEAMKILDYLGGMDFVYLVAAVFMFAVVEHKWIKDKSIVRLLSMLSGGGLGWYMLGGDIKAMIIGLAASLVAVLARLTLIAWGEARKTNAITWKAALSIAAARLVGVE